MPNLLKNEPIARALYRTLIQEKKHGGVDGVARRLGIPVSTLYAYAENRHQFPAWLIAPLYAATNDVELLAEIVGTDGVTISRTADPADCTIESIANAGLIVGQSAGALQGELVRAIADGEIDEAEDEAIDKAIDELHRRAERLRALKSSKTVRLVKTKARVS